MIQQHSLLTLPVTAKVFRELKPTEMIVDVGPGIRPCPVFPCKAHICVEPHSEYVTELIRGGWRVIQEQAEAIDECTRAGTTVLMLDVIEHLERERGEAIRDLLEEFEQAVVFTPLGPCEQGDQNPDAWGMNGGYWQKHRSAWHPEDFPGWQVHVWPKFHSSKGVGAFMAVHAL